jgi:hypothetical protein
MKSNEPIAFELLSLLLAGCLGPPRPYEIESEQKSPAGTVLASVTRQGYGGAAGGLEYKIFLTNGPDADLTSEPVVAFTHDCTLKLTWVNPNALVVEYNGGGCEV